MPLPRVALVEFPADDTDRARRFWSGVMGIEPEPSPGPRGSGSIPITFDQKRRARSVSSAGNSTRATRGSGMPAP